MAAPVVVSATGKIGNEFMEKCFTFWPLKTDK